MDGFRLAKAMVFKAISAMGFGVGHVDSFVIIPSTNGLI